MNNYMVLIVKSIVIYRTTVPRTIQHKVETIKGSKNRVVDAEKYLKGLKAKITTKRHSPASLLNFFAKATAKASTSSIVECDE